MATEAVRRAAGAVWRFGARWGLVVALGLLALAPTDLVESGPIVCPLRATTGLDCPGCGMTRAVSCWLHGEFERGIEFNVGVVVVLPLLIVVAIRQAVSARPAG